MNYYINQSINQENIQLNITISKNQITQKMDKQDELLAFLFGGVFISIFLFLLFKLIYRIYEECKKNRMARRNNQLLLANSLYHIT